ncbi:hypothetical protein AB0K40_45715 [Nonomuraea bangladeshensis]|uniref:Uncharacterized protein n=1 Tax=Nonomuraea bangladeshensis TaxID=404385 RepID=A0ABV3HKE8_9ACTN
MTAHQPGRQEPDPDQTIRHRLPHPESPPPSREPQDPPATRRLDYTPDMLPDVQLYEAKPPRAGWWWMIVVGGLVLLLGALAVAGILWVRSTQSSAAGPVPGAAVTSASAP